MTYPDFKIRIEKRSTILQIVPVQHFVRHDLQNHATSDNLDIISEAFKNQEQSILMKIYLEEKIGNPDLFTGRRQELKELLAWTEKTRKKLSQSRALLSRRKTGKTALLQRLYNIIFDADDKVIPFYYEVKEEEQWAIDFCQDFFTKFILQYIAFKSRKPEYINVRKIPYGQLIEIAEKESQSHLTDLIKNVESLVNEKSVSLLWDSVRDAPRSVAEILDERVVQIIDEFQYLNRMIYDDREKKRLHRMAQPYMSTAEYKNAPLIISGSWVGLLMHDVLRMPGRFQITFLEMMPKEEAIEMVYKYCLAEEIPVTRETADLIAGISEGNPFYITALIRSVYPEKDLATQDGVLKILEFETLDKRANIKGTWMEYILYAFSEVNEKNAKNIVLHLCKNKDRELTRAEILKDLNLDMTDSELEKKLKSLVNADIIEQGQTNFDYRAVGDNIFDKVFRGFYQKEIEGFDPREITNEYKALSEKLLAKYRKISGERSYYKGMYAEFMIIRRLTYHAYKDNGLYLSMMQNLPEDFVFAEFESVWSYKSVPVHKKEIQIDVFARAKPGYYSMIGEVKNRETEKFSYDEAVRFAEKAEILKESEKTEKAVLFVFSRAGFTDDSLNFLKEQGIARSDDERWISESKSRG
ncbi:MAG: hypothetical protein GY795_39075 [Desulfobacterales bacterium]|nr:hypothetical protein [Desulfobacterales bacterium]